MLQSPSSPQPAAVPAAGRPRVVVLGGPDVDARIPLLHALARDYEVAALGSEPGLAARFSAAGIPYVVYPLDRRLSPFTDLRTLRHLVRLLRSIRPDVVHAFDTKPGVYGCIAARRAGVPVVVTTVTGLGSLFAADDLRTRLLRRVYTSLQRIASRRADVTVFQNHDDARELVAARVVPRDRAEVILGSGLDTDRFDPARVDPLARSEVRTELGIPADAVVVMMIARVTRQKGIAEFVDAATRVTATRRDVRFLLVGGDDPDGRGRLTAAELDRLRASVIWPGHRRDIPRLLAAADVFVLPTAYREGVPRVLLEAGAMGLPLVATDSPGCNEVALDGVTGRLVPVGDAAALTAAIQDLAADAALRARLGEAARRRVVSQFDLRTVVDQTHRLYQRLLALAAARRHVTDATSKPVANSMSR